MVFAKLWMPDRSEHGREIEVALNSSIAEVTDHAGKLVGISSADFDVYYLGRKLNRDTKLSDCVQLKDTQNVYVMRCRDSAHDPLSQATASGLGDLEALVTSLQTAWSDSMHRNLLIKVMSNREAINTLVSTTPGLKTDPVAQTVLRDPYLLLQWLSDRNVVQKIVKDHRCIVEAGQQILSSMHAEAAQLGLNVNPLLLMDDDDDGGESGDEQMDQAAGGQQANNRAAGITPEQLANALAAAGPTQPARAPLNVAPPPAAAANQPSGSQTPGSITAEMFQRAMQQVLGAATGAQPANYDAALVELRGMGFTDEQENLRALRASGGDVQRALEFIINERERMSLD